MHRLPIAHNPESEWSVVLGPGRLTAKQSQRILDATEHHASLEEGNGQTARREAQLSNIFMRQQVPLGNKNSESMQAGVLIIADHAGLHLRDKEDRREKGSGDRIADSCLPQGRASMGSPAFLYLGTGIRQGKADGLDAHSQFCVTGRRIRK